jgi:hypothetical protein
MFKLSLNIKLQGINPVAFEVLLKYIYTGVLQITSEVASDLMTMSETLKMPRVKALVTEYMESLPLEDAFYFIKLITYQFASRNIFIHPSSSLRRSVSS